MVPEVRAEVWEGKRLLEQRISGAERPEGSTGHSQDAEAIRSDDGAGAGEAATPTCRRLPRESRDQRGGRWPTGAGAGSKDTPSNQGYVF